jgi:hypothetical protein
MEITIPNDFKELLELLNSHKVDYIIVGTSRVPSLYRRLGYLCKAGRPHVRLSG